MTEVIGDGDCGVGRRAGKIESVAKRTNAGETTLKMNTSKLEEIVGIAMATAVFVA